MMAVDAIDSVRSGHGTALAASCRVRRRCGRAPPIRAPRRSRCDAERPPPPIACPAPNATRTAREGGPI